MDNKDKKKHATADAAALVIEAANKAESAQIDKLRELGKAIIVGMGEVAEKYLTLVMFIRNNKVAPKLVSVQLAKLGFKRSRVAELNRIAQASDKVFKQYEAKLIGFRGALDLARAEKGKQPALTEAGSLLLEEGKFEDTEQRAMLKTGEPAGDHKKQQKTLAVRMNDAANFILMNAKGEKTWWFKKSKFKLLLVAAHPETGDFDAEAVK